MVRAKTLAVVVGIAACTMTFAVAGADRFIHHTIVALGFDDSQSALTAQAQLRKGIVDYQWGRYDDANGAFEQASKLPGLSEREQEILAQYRALMVRVNKYRLEANNLLQAAHKAYEQGDLKQAESLAHAAALNGYASTEVLDQAKGILAKVQSSNGTSQGGKAGSDVATRRDAQQLIAKARQHLRQGNIDDAESLARKADSLKISFSRFEDSPAKVLKDVADARGGKSATSANQTVASNSKPKAKSLVAEALACLKRNDLNRAEELAKQAKDMKVNFFMLETSPDDVLADVQEARTQSGSIAAQSNMRQPAVKQAEEIVLGPESPPKEVVRASQQSPVAPQPSRPSVLVLEAWSDEPTATGVASSHAVESPLVQSTEPSAGPGAVANQESVVAAPAAGSVESEASRPRNTAPAADEQTKAEVRQLLAQARKLIDNGHLDEAEQIVARAESYEVVWGTFDNPVLKTRRDLAAARNQAMTSDIDSLDEAHRPSNSSVASATGDARVEALELLRQGRAHLRVGNVEKAEEIARLAGQKKAKYRLLDDTPKQLLAECAQSRSRIKSATPGASETIPAVAIVPEVAEISTVRPEGNDKEVIKQAQTLLKKAREHLNRGDYDNASEIARRVGAWHLNYGFWDDTPSKVENLAKTMKNRAIARASRGQGETDRNVAESLVAEARRELQRGDFDAAEAKARQAQQLKTSFRIFSDRPETVLAEISRARRSSGGSQKIAPQSVDPSAQSTEVVQAENRFDPASNSHKTASQRAPIEIVTSDSRRHSVNSEDGTSSEPPPEAIEWLAGAKTSLLTAPRRMPSGQDQHYGQNDSRTIIQTGSDSGADSEVKQADGIDIGNPSALVNPDQQKLAMARKLFEQGNYPRARDYAVEVYSNNAALRPQADDLIARISVAEQAMAVQLFDAGIAALKKKEYTRALSFFQQVNASGAQLDPAMEQQLRSYLRDLPARAGPTSGGNSGVAVVSNGNVQRPTPGDSTQEPSDDLGQRERAKFQQLVTETNQKLQAARLLLPSNPSQAIADLELAQEAVRVSGLDDYMTGPLLRRLDGTIRYASQEKQRLDFENLQKAAQVATKSQRERQLAVENQKQRELSQFVERGQVFLKEGHYSDAELQAKKALEVDPDNLAAIAVFHKAKIEGQLAIQRELRDQKESALLGTLIGVDKSAIPWGDDTLSSVKYPDPKKWEDLTESRKRRFEAIEKASRSPMELEIERKLYEPISINFTETPLAEVVAWLHDFTGVNVFLDKQALAVDGISSDKPITIKLEKVPLKSALKLILNQMELEYTVEDDVLLITTPIKRQGKMYPKSYSVADLAVPISPFHSQNVAGPNWRNPAGSLGIGGGMPGLPAGGMPMHNAALAQMGNGLGGSPSLINGNGSMPGYDSSGMVGTTPGGMNTGQNVDFDSLITLIEQTISPNSWSSVGGAGTIEPFRPNLSLVVNQTQAVHDQIADLLTQLRRLQDLQVTVEVKFVTLTEDFFERIGIDFDIDVQSDAQKPLRSFGQVIIPGSNGGGGGGGAAQQQIPPVLNLLYNDHDDDVTVGVNGAREANGLGVGGFPAFTPDLKIPFRTGGFGLGRPSSFRPGDGLSFGIAFLSDIEVFLFLEAAQQNNRGNVLTAPKVTLFNGETAFVFSGTIEPFVTALNPVVAAGAVAFDPQIQQFFNGAFLTVQAVISADRRYVRLALFPNFTNITGEKRFTVTGGAGGGGGFGGGFGGGGGGGGGGAGGGGAANAQAEIVVPIIATNFVATTVSVPDGGTVMMGGLKTKSEIRNEFGTPILNKIPYVQRLFMNTGVSSVSRSLLLMVTPRIIIQEEEEELLGKTMAF